MALTRGKRKLAESNGKVILLKRPLNENRSKKKKRKQHDELHRSYHDGEVCYMSCAFLPMDLMRYILSFVGTGQYLFVASVNTTFRQVLRSMPENDFMTHPSSYMMHTKSSRNLFRWIKKGDVSSMKFPKKWIAINYAIKYDGIYQFTCLLRKCRFRPNSNWRTGLGKRALKYNAVNILKWLIQELKFDIKNMNHDIVRHWVRFYNLCMVKFLHRWCKIDFTFDSIRKMIIYYIRTKKYRPSLEVVRYLLDSVPPLTIDQSRLLYRLAIVSRYQQLIKMIHDEFVIA